MRAAGQTQARFLLTSRRDEGGWLGELPTRITLPKMPFLERAQLAAALISKHGGKMSDVEDWRPLLEFTAGNPLTITVLVGQALRDKVKSKQQIEEFVAKLRAGESAFQDEVAEGRDKSLGASLSYGFENAFDEVDKSRIALLHLFQQVVNVRFLEHMGDPASQFCIPEVRGFNATNWTELLDRAAEVGLLTVLGRGVQRSSSRAVVPEESVRPVLPPRLFDRRGPRRARKGNSRLRTCRQHFRRPLPPYLRNPGSSNCRGFVSRRIQSAPR